MNYKTIKLIALIAAAAIAVFGAAVTLILGLNLDTEFQKSTVITFTSSSEANLSELSGKISGIAGTQNIIITQGRDFSSENKNHISITVNGKELNEEKAAAVESAVSSLAEGAVRLDCGVTLPDYNLNSLLTPAVIIGIILLLAVIYGFARYKLYNVLHALSPAFSVLSSVLLTAALGMLLRVTVSEYSVYILVIAAAAAFILSSAVMESVRNTRINERKNKTPAEVIETGIMYVLKASTPVFILIFTALLISGAYMMFTGFSYAASFPFLCMSAVVSLYAGVFFIGAPVLKK